MSESFKVYSLSADGKSWAYKYISFSDETLLQSNYEGGYGAPLARYDDIQAIILGKKTVGLMSNWWSKTQNNAFFFSIVTDHICFDFVASNAEDRIQLISALIERMSSEVTNRFRNTLRSLGTVDTFTIEFQGSSILKQPVCWKPEEVVQSHQDRAHEDSADSTLSSSEELFRVRIVRVEKNISRSLARAKSKRKRSSRSSRGRSRNASSAHKSERSTVSMRIQDLEKDSLSSDRQKLESESKTRSKSKPRSEPSSKASSTSGLKSKTDLNAVSQSASKSASESGLKSVSKSDSKSSSESDSKLTSKSGSKSETKSGSNSGSKSGSESGSKSETKSGSESASKSGSESGSKSETKPGSKQESKYVSRAESASWSGSESEPDCPVHGNPKVEAGDGSDDDSTLYRQWENLMKESQRELKEAKKRVKRAEKRQSKAKRDVKRLKKKLHAAKDEKQSK